MKMVRIICLLLILLTNYIWGKSAAELQKFQKKGNVNDQAFYWNGLNYSIHDVQKRR